MQASIRRILVGAFCGSIAAFLVIASFPGTFEASSGTEPPPSIVPADPLSDPREPRRLEIPHLAIDAPVERVGINNRGEMATPRDFDAVGWYRLGPRPGALETAVMAGHVDDGRSLSGVFSRLEETRPGDAMYVKDGEGKRILFRIEEIRSYPYTEVPFEKVFARDDAPRLTLITCTGAWIPELKTYDARLIVYAVLAEE